LIVDAAHITPVISYANAAYYLGRNSPAMMIDFAFERGALNANGIMEYSKGMMAAGIFAQLSLMLHLMA
jgi:hypothetical protein